MSSSGEEIEKLFNRAEHSALLNNAVFGKHVQERVNFIKKAMQKKTHEDILKDAFMFLMVKRTERDYHAFKRDFPHLYVVIMEAMNRVEKSKND